MMAPICLLTRTTAWTSEPRMLFVGQLIGCSRKLWSRLVGMRCSSVACVSFLNKGCRRGVEGKM